MKSIKDLLLAAVEMYGEELSENGGYRDLYAKFMDRFAAIGGAVTEEQSNELFDAYCDFSDFIEQYFYEKGLRDGMAICGVVKEAMNA